MPGPNKHPSIFVAIASYRDPECQHTVRDLFAKAKFPGRVNVGICWQLDVQYDGDCVRLPPPFPRQVREKNYHAKDSLGGCWARAEALSMMKDEDFVLMIDAHMRFAEDWDETFIAQWAACPSEKAALTAAAPGYTPPDTLQETEGRRLITVNEIGKPGDPQLMHMGIITWDPKQLAPGPLPTPFIIANCLFAPARMFRDVPYDPYIYFRGQEPAYSARLFTHGWDVFQPEPVIAWHYWGSQSRAAGTGADYKKGNERSVRGRMRVAHLLGIEQATDPAALKHIARYGMGRQRSLAEFWRYAGVDVKAGTLAWEATKGRWTPYQPMGLNARFAIAAKPDRTWENKDQPFLPRATEMGEG